jgi:hypothetical protein
MEAKVLFWDRDRHNHCLVFEQQIMVGKDQERGISKLLSACVRKPLIGFALWKKYWLSAPTGCWEGNFYGRSEKNSSVSAPRFRTDITDYERTIETIKRLEPQVVINVAAFTFVDLCEQEKEKALQ